MKLLGKYQNGNYTVTIFNNGTKIRENNLDFFKANFPESFDFKITNKCNGNCPFCHENSNINGKHGNIMNFKFINSLHPFTEIAIGGGNPLSHPDLIPFLEKCKELKLIPSMTINQKHFIEEYNLIKKLVNEKLIYGIGISFTNIKDKEFLKLVKNFPNAVLHIIAGIISIEELEKIKGYKILLLGYKHFRRGESLYQKIGNEIEKEIEKLKEKLPAIIKENWFKVVSFDNLALKQLNVKHVISEEVWNECYMGEDGIATMYIDGVEEKFALSSTSTERYPLKHDIKDMFEVVRR